MTVDQVRQYASSERGGKLLCISDVAALVNGPIEFFREECKIEKPYFLYDPTTDQSYESYQELAHHKGSDKSFVY